MYEYRFVARYCTVRAVVYKSKGAYRTAIIVTLSYRERIAYEREHGEHATRGPEWYFPDPHPVHSVSLLDSVTQTVKDNYYCRNL